MLKLLENLAPKKEKKLKADLFTYFLFHSKHRVSLPTALCQIAVTNSLTLLKIPTTNTVN